jgi:anti-sigma regulatory factor (Ser/Thr protein kinase)
MLELAALPSASQCARKHTRQALRDWNLADLGEPAELIISELVTNAIEASRASGTGLQVRLAMFSDHERLLIQVHDSNPEPPVACHGADMAEAGRGLILVDSVSAAWDWYAKPPGKVVWAVLLASSCRS